MLRITYSVMQTSEASRLVIAGAGELGQQIRNLAGEDRALEVVGFVDDWMRVGEKVDGLPVLGRCVDLGRLFESGEFDSVVCAIGYKHLRARAEFHRSNASTLRFASIIHKTAWVADTAQVGDGCVIYPRAVVDKGVVVGPNCIINLACVISHDCKIGGHSYLSPSTTLGGYVELGEECFVGIGASIFDGVIVGSPITIGGGSVVTKNLSDRGIYYGVPAQWVRED